MVVASRLGRQHVSGPNEEQVLSDQPKKKNWSSQPVHSESFKHMHVDADLDEEGLHLVQQILTKRRILTGRLAGQLLSSRQKKLTHRVASPRPQNGLSGIVVGQTPQWSLCEG